ncbi:hypothetical protein BCO26_2390 [Heyndrickxia coagulans 2-6]|nr:hypothetical protein BCO26_2390 [Heyndrickxia coagulans 2-6]
MIYHHDCKKEQKQISAICKHGRTGTGIHDKQDNEKDEIAFYKITDTKQNQKGMVPFFLHDSTSLIFA